MPRRSGYETETAETLAEHVTKIHGLALAIYDEDIRILEDRDSRPVETVTETVSIVTDRVHAIVRTANDLADHVFETDGILEALDERVMELQTEVDDLQTRLDRIAAPFVAETLLHELRGRAGDDDAAGALRWITAALSDIARVDDDEAFPTILNDAVRLVTV